MSEGIENQRFEETNSQPESDPLNSTRIFFAERNPPKPPEDGLSAEDTIEPGENFQPGPTLPEAYPLSAEGMEDNEQVSATTKREKLKEKVEADNKLAKELEEYLMDPRKLAVLLNIARHWKNGENPESIRLAPSIHTWIKEFPNARFENNHAENFQDLQETGFFETEAVKSSTPRALLRFLEEDSKSRPGAEEAFVADMIKRVTMRDKKPQFLQELVLSYLPNQYGVVENLMQRPNNEIFFRPEFLIESVLSKLDPQQDIETIIAVLKRLHTRQEVARRFSFSQLQSDLHSDVARGRFARALKTMRERGKVPEANLNFFHNRIVPTLSPEDREVAEKALRNIEVDYLISSKIRNLEKLLESFESIKTEQRETNMKLERSDYQQILSVFSEDSKSFPDIYSSTKAFIRNKWDDYAQSNSVYYYDPEFNSFTFESDAPEVFKAYQEFVFILIENMVSEVSSDENRDFLLALVAKNLPQDRYKIASIILMKIKSINAFDDEPESSVLKALQNMNNLNITPEERQSIFIALNDSELQEILDDFAVAENVKKLTQDELEARQKASS